MLIKPTSTQTAYKPSPLTDKTTIPKNIISKARKIGNTAPYTFHGIAMFEA
jgi:hypothetical protein